MLMILACLFPALAGTLFCVSGMQIRTRNRCLGACVLAADLICAAAALKGGRVSFLTLSENLHMTFAADDMGLFFLAAVLLLYTAVCFYAFEYMETEERTGMFFSFYFLSENAEYDAAKDEQRDIEARIEELENLLKYAEVYVDEEASTDAVGIGSNVKVLDLEFDEELDFKIVGSTEANSLEGKISNESPVGAALLRKQVGDLITVETQMGPLQYRILGISRDQG